MTEFTDRITRIQRAAAAAKGLQGEAASAAYDRILLGERTGKSAPKGATLPDPGKKAVAAMTAHPR